jgi:serpin B
MGCVNQVSKSLADQSTQLPTMQQKATGETSTKAQEIRNPQVTPKDHKPNQDADHRATELKTAQKDEKNNHVAPPNQVNKKPDQAPRTEEPLAKTPPTTREAQPTEKATTLPSASKDVAVHSSNSFALALYKQLVHTHPKTNLFFSPWSLHNALSMTFAGAKGKTAESMAKVLALPEKSEHIHASYAELLKKLRVERGQSRLIAKQKIWGQEQFAWSEHFLSLLKNAYQSEFGRVTFDKNPELVRRKINNEIAKSTENRITNLLPTRSVTIATRMVLTNAIYFLGTWKSRFEKKDTQKQRFFIQPKKSISVPMMSQKGRFKLFINENYSLLSLPYHGNFEMQILLPSSSVGLSDLEKRLNKQELLKARTSAEMKLVHVFLPRFRVTQSFSLKKVLSAMGMGEAFGSNADFSGMITKNESKLYLSGVYHKAFVKVDEKGTEAAAASGVVVGSRSIGPRYHRFVVDRPFIFIIRDLQTGVFLFMGRISNPLSHS